MDTSQSSSCSCRLSDPTSSSFCSSGSSENTGRSKRAHIMSSSNINDVKWTTTISTTNDTAMSGSFTSNGSGTGNGAVAPMMSSAAVAAAMPVPSSLVSSSTATPATRMAMMGNAQRTSSLNEQDDPTAAFTTADEQRELATVSPTELADAETDLRGIMMRLDGIDLAGTGASTGAAGGAGADGGAAVGIMSSAAGQPAQGPISATPQQLQLLSVAESQSHALHLGTGLRRLEEEIALLPVEYKDAYLMALRRCPPLVGGGGPNAASAAGVGGGGIFEPWDCYRSAFLEREGYDAAAAARKLCKYWKVKRSMFGADAYCPYSTNGGGGDMTLNQCFTHSELENYLHHNLCHLLEERDGAGRAILFLDPSRRDLSKFSTESSMKALFYIFQKVAKDPIVRRRGFVLIVNMRIASTNYNRSSMKTLLPFIYDNLPLRCRAVHLINPSAISYYVILPVIKYFLGREMRLRLKVHYGSASEVARSMAEYRLTTDVLPQEVGGSVRMDREAWMAARLMEEEPLMRQQLQQQQLQLQQQQQQQQQQAVAAFNLAAFEPTPMKEPDHDASLSSFLADLEPIPVTEPPVKRRRSDQLSISDEDTEHRASESNASGTGSLHPRPINTSLAAADVATSCGGISSPPINGRVDGLQIGSPALSSSASMHHPTAPQVSGAGTEAGVKKPAKRKTSRPRKPSKKASAATSSAEANQAVGASGGDKRKGGRQSDPRMNHAIAAKMENASLSLREALEAGGFVFPPTTVRCSAGKIVDNEGITLAQRKNQLSRRLRALKKKEEEESGSGEEESKKSQAPAAAAASAVETVVPMPDTAESMNGMRPSTNNDEPPRKRCDSDSDDSFFDMVKELPGIDVGGVEMEDSNL